MRSVHVPAERVRNMDTIKAIFGIIAIGAVIYCAAQVVPVEMSNYSFQDDLRNIAMVAGGNYKLTDQDVLQQVMQKAKEREIALTPEQVTVQRIGTAGAPAVYVGADYNVSVSLAVYSFNLHFTPSSGNKL
jgi:hypothetical protein